MGVNKLWDILLTIAVQKNVEDLSGLILAIDASLWIVKVNSIFQNLDDALKCLFNKILWLKKNNIHPIFVFDGDSPPLKRQTLQTRRSRRSQLNDIELAKKAQIQIVKAIEGSQLSQKSEQNSVYNQKSKEIEQMLNNLLKYEKVTNTIDLSQKIALQGEVLNKKYELYCEMTPTIINKYGNLDYFSSLDIQSKEQILQNIKVEDLPSYKEMETIKNRMSEEEKIIYDMEIIKKNSKIRQLQDQLYRKVLTKKIQNGFEIVQGIYNGKKVIQKRKVKKNTFCEWEQIRSKKNRCNDFKQILDSRKTQDKGELDGNTDGEPSFFSSIFSRNYNEQKGQFSNNVLRQMSQRLSEKNSAQKQKQSKHNGVKAIKDNKIVSWSSNCWVQKQKEQEEQDSYQNCFNEVEPKMKNQKGQKISNGDDPDNFPDYLMNESLDEMHRSSKNMHFQNILQILGINYIIAPYEAEAQCATLQQMGLVDGVVTEDSDVFLFGARNVYRGLFQDNIKFYWMANVQRKLMLTREKLILFALMLGSDYTDGVKGIGIVNAMEILKVHHELQSLQKFTSWAKNADILHDDDSNKTDSMLQNAASEDEKQFYQLHRKYKNYWYIHPTFPQQHIYNAYSKPLVQQGEQLIKKVKEHKEIHIDALRKLMIQKFGMTHLQIEMNVKIFTKIFQRKIQTSITDYASEGTFAKIASKRLKRAIDLPDINH